MRFFLYFMNFLPYVESIKTNTLQPKLNTTAQTDTGPEATGSVSGSADTHLQVGTAPTTTGFRSDLSCTIKQSNHTNILASLTHNTMANNDNQNEVSTGDGKPDVFTFFLLRTRPSTFNKIAYKDEARRKLRIDYFRHFKPTNFTIHTYQHPPPPSDDYRSIEAEDSTTTSLATAVEEQLLTSPTKTSSDSGRITPVFPEGERIIDALGTGAEDSGPHVPDVEESSTAGSGVSVIRRTLEGLGRTRTPISCSQMVDRLRGEHRAGNRSRRNSDRSSQLNAARGVDNSDLGDDGDLPASQGSPFRSAAGHFAPSDSPYLITNCSNDDDEDPSSTSQTQPPADLHLQSGEAGRGGESSLKRSPEEQAPASGLEEEVGAGVKKGRKKRRGKSRSKNNNNDNTNNNNNDEGDADAPLPTPAEVYGSHESKLTLTVHRKGADSGAMDVVARQLFMVPEHIRVTAILPRPDGAIVEVADSSSAETVRAALSNQGWTVDIDQIWARYEFTVPAQLAGTNPNHSGLDAITLVRGLTIRNRHNGLPGDSLRYVSHHWDLLNAGGNSGGPSTGGSRHRLRIWVDVSPEGEVFLREHGYLLETLVAAIRLRRASRNRQTQHD